MSTIPDKKPGRNEPCWCGSGKKYKQCHLRQDQEDALMARQAAAAEALAAAPPPVPQPIIPPPTIQP